MEQPRLKIGLACCVGIAACSLILLTGPEPLEASLPEEKPRISIGKLERIVVANTVTAFGVLSPRQSLELTTQVPGEITWVSDNLDAGGQVAEGDLLLRIDERDYAIAVASAEAHYAQAQATIDIEEGRSEIARLEWSAWQATHDEEMPANPLALREPQRAEAVARRKAIRAELDRAKLALERTAIRAPWPASVVAADAIVGQVVSVGEVTATLFPLDYAVAELQVPLKTVRLLDAGIDRVELRPVHDLSAAPVVGTFEGIVRNLTDDTRLATVRVRIEAPLEHEGWAYGMHLEAKLVAKQRRTVALIPADLIVSGNLIWIYRDGRAQRHQLYPIENQGQTVSVEDNFGAGDTLIVERPIGLFDGARVDVAEM
jgi:RND family efflux transporter MFP subunit